MPVLSQMWASLSAEEKEQWKEKAKGFSWISTPEQKKNAIRELVTSTRENVSLCCRGSYQVSQLLSSLSTFQLNFFIQGLPYK